MNDIIDRTVVSFRPAKVVKDAVADENYVDLGFGGRGTHARRTAVLVVVVAVVFGLRFGAGVGVGRGCAQIELSGALFLL